MTNPYGYFDYERQLGARSPVAELEWQDFLKRRKEMVDLILNESHSLAENDKQLQRNRDTTPQGISRTPFANMQGQQQQPTTMPLDQPRLAARDELIGQARAWGIENPEQIPPSELAEMIQHYRDIMPREEYADPGSRALMMFGAAAEAGGMTERFIGNFLGIPGTFDSIPFIGPVLSSILGTEKAKRFMYDLSVGSAEFVEQVRMAQPSEDKTATQVALATGKVIGTALPAILAWETMGAAGGILPPAWQMIKVSPIVKLAVRGGLSSALLVGGSDEPAAVKAFDIGLGTLLGPATMGKFAMPVLGGTVGAAVGAGIGDTPEERQRHMIEMGIAGLALGTIPLFATAMRKAKTDMPSPFDIQVNEQISIRSDMEMQKLLSPGTRRATATMSEPPVNPTEPDFVVHSDDLMRQMQEPPRLPAEVGRKTNTADDLGLVGDEGLIEHYKAVRGEVQRTQGQDPTLMQQFQHVAAEMEARGMSMDEPTPMWNDMKPLSMQDAVSSAEIMNKQNTVLESVSLPGAMARTKMGDADVIDASLVNNPGGVTIVRGLVNAAELAGTNRPVTFVQRGGQFDALVGRVTPSQVAEYQQHGLFTGQTVITPDGIEGRVAIPFDPASFTERGGAVHLKTLDGHTLPMAARDVMLSRYSEPVIEAPDLWQDFRTNLMMSVNDQALASDMQPVYEITDPRVTSIMQPHMSAFFDNLDIQDNGIRQALEADFNKRWVSEIRQLDPESAQIQDDVAYSVMDSYNYEYHVDSRVGGELVPEARQARAITISTPMGRLRIAGEMIGPDELYIANIMPLDENPDGPGLMNKLGVSGVRKLIPLIQEQFPGVRKVTGERITGARGKIAEKLTGDDLYNYTGKTTVSLPVSSIEEAADKRGFIWISKPGEGGVLRDGVNPASPDIPMETDDAASEFLRLHDRAMPDLGPASDVPAEVAMMVPSGMRFDPRLTTEALGESLTEGLAALSEPLNLGSGGGGGVIPPSGGFVPPGGGGPPQLPPGQRETLGGQFAALRRSDPRKLNAMLDNFQSLLSSQLRYTRYAMLGMEENLFKMGVDLGKAWQHYDALDVARNQASNEGLPWINEWSDIMRYFPRLAIRDGSVTRFHEIEDPNARYAAWYRWGEKNGLSKGKVQNAIMGDERMTDFMHRFFGYLTNDPSFALTADREIFRYMPHVRARQSQGLNEPYKADWLNPNVEFFAEFAREGNMQMRVVDARELGTHMVRAAMFKKFEAEPWKNLVEAWQDPRIPESLRDYMMDYAKLSRYGYDPRGDLAVRGVQGVFRQIFRTPLTPHEAQHLLNMPIGGMYMSMLAGRSSIFFRDAMQPILALAKVRAPYMAAVYGDILKGAGRAITSADLGRLRVAYDRGIGGGWIERENPNLEAPGIFENTVGEIEEQLALRPGEANRREMLARVGDVAHQLPAWLVRPSESNISTLKWYGRQGQLHRLIVGEASYRQAVDLLTAYRQTHIQAVINRNPDLAMPYEKLADDAFFSSFERPIQRKLQELVEAGDDEGAAQLFARQVANWSQFKYGRKEMPVLLRNTFGRMVSMLGSFSGQFLEGLFSATLNGTARQRVRYWNVIGGFSLAMYGLKKATGWSFDKWAFLPQALQFSGGPMAESIATAALGLQGAVTSSSGYSPSPVQSEALRSMVGGPSMADYFPYTGYVRSAAEYGDALKGTNPLEQMARYTVTGDKGSRIDVERMLQGYDQLRQQGPPVPTGSIPPKRDDALPGDQGYRIPRREEEPEGSGGFFQ